jgi:hypothetical protein
MVCDYYNNSEVRRLLTEFQVPSSKFKVKTGWGRSETKLTKEIRGPDRGPDKNQDSVMIFPHHLFS